MIMYLLRMPRWARMEAGQIKGHQFSIVASRINISRTVPSSLYVTQRFPSMIAKNQVFSTNFLGRVIKMRLEQYSELGVPRLNLNNIQQFTWFQIKSSHAPATGPCISAVCLCIYSDTLHTV